MVNNYFLLAFFKLASSRRKRNWEVETENYVVEQLRRVKNKDSYQWRRKVVKDKHGYRHIINLACKNGKCVATSVWHPKNEPMAQKAKKYVSKK